MNVTNDLTICNTPDDEIARMNNVQPNSRSQQRCGSVSLIAVIMMIMLCMVCAVTVDLGYMPGAKSRMQSAADAAALAAVMRVGNENTADDRAAAQDWAVEFANQNLPDVDQTLVPADVVFGSWDPATKTFAAGGVALSAVQVKVRRDGTNSAGIQTAFMKIFGWDEINMTATSTASIASSSAAEGMPFALRDPDFGAVDLDVTAANPDNDGPSVPANGVSFQVGDTVVLGAYGKDYYPAIGLALAYDDKGPGASEGDVKKILKGDDDPVEMQVGDEVEVLSEGVDDDDCIKALDDRLKLADDDPDRDVVLPVVETLADSRNEYGELTGSVRIADFVAVHLDEIIELEVVNPKDISKTVKVKFLIGTVMTRRTETSWGGATPSGAGGATVGVIELVE